MEQGQARGSQGTHSAEWPLPPYSNSAPPPLLKEKVWGICARDSAARGGEDPGQMRAHTQYKIKARVWHRLGACSAPHHVREVAGTVAAVGTVAMGGMVVAAAGLPPRGICHDFPRVLLTGLLRPPWMLRLTHSLLEPPARPGRLIPAALADF